MKPNLQPRRARRGFTLAEMMVVIVIIGLLATLVVPSVIQRFFTAQKTKAAADISAITQSLTEYAMQNSGKYPESLEALVTQDENGHCFLEGYNGKIPKDPWRFEYQYEPPQQGHPQPRVYSMGKDGAPGGEGEDADIDSDHLKDQ
ncbi:MAG: type II secretion system major pseudopilin GspG [Planctomycetes bacterium]|nr:type II secretion system major pseudopilin GspG [Planctomycetota bacterium]